jgi:uncharacterized HAD superfamily protein
MAELKTYCFDIDGTICDGDYTKQPLDYSICKPIQSRIDIVNKLYDAGNEILFDTARNKKWESLTKQQLDEWGVKYHTLRVGSKLHADVFVDDRGVNDNEFFK